MTLATHVRVREPVPVEPLFRFCQSLLGGDPEMLRVGRERQGDYPSWVRDPDDLSPEYADFLRNPYSSIHNEPGQGLSAWLFVYYGEDGPLRRSEDDERPDAAVEVVFDTAYGYTGPRGGGCEDLHAWLVGAVGDYLDEQGATWGWQNEYTGEWHEGREGLDAFGDRKRGALCESGLTSRDEEAP